jgi:thioredoxin reductase
LAEVGARPYPPGRYDVVVVGSGPGGLQTSHCLTGFGVPHALLSADDSPGGMFRRFPVFERLISWTKPDAPFERGTREYEAYDHNSLLGHEPHQRALVPTYMDRAFDVPARPEMESALVEFVERAGVQVRYGCRWESTRREEDGFTLTTSDGEYRCRAAVFALGVTEAWSGGIRGADAASHYVDTGTPSSYQGKSVVIIGKRNSGFELASGLLPWAREIVLVSPRPVRFSVLARSPLRVRYLQPFEEYVRGGSGALVVDAAVDRIERRGDGFTVFTNGTTWPHDLRFDSDEVIVATGFQTPLRDLPALGVATMADGRIPAQTPYWESVSVPGIHFAGNVTQGSPGLQKQGLASNSSSVNGFRYNARVLARHLAEKLGYGRPRRTLEPGEVIGFLLRELARAPELWIQKGYLARVVTFTPDGIRDEGILPLEHYVDAVGEDSVAVAVEMNSEGTIYPALYVRRDRKLSEHQLEPHPTYAFDSGRHRDQLDSLLRPLLKLSGAPAD